jgi:hypothetical protein
MRHTTHGRTGICLVRAEAQDDRIHITIRLNPDIRHESTERTATVPDIEAAVNIVREFLIKFTEEGGTSPGTSPD